jgi:hypothetical protein
MYIQLERAFYRVIESSVMKIFMVAICLLVLYCTNNISTNPQHFTDTKNLSISSAIVGESYKADKSWNIFVVFENIGDVDVKINSASLKAFDSLGAAINEFSVSSSTMLYNVVIPSRNLKVYSISGGSSVSVIYSFAILYSLNSSDDSLSKNIMFPKSFLAII